MLEGGSVSRSGERFDPGAPLKSPAVEAPSS
jgi:hypothetical protein